MVTRESHEHEQQAVVDQQVTSSQPGAWNVARGWVRTLGAFIGLIVLVIETLLVFRLGFALGNANQANGFVDFIYDTSGPFVDPFEGISAERSVDGGVFEPETAIGMAVWLIVGLLLIALLWVVTSGPAFRGDRSVTTRERHATRVRDE